MTSYCLPRFPLHYIPPAKLCYALIPPGQAVSHNPIVKHFISFPAQDKHFFIEHSVVSQPPADQWEEQQNSD